MKTTPEFEAKLAALARLIEDQTRDRLQAEGPKNEFYDEVIAQNCKVTTTLGKTYARVDMGGSGKYMVDEAGNIFGIKAYGVIHRGHQYGTLDTVADWYWGGYKALRMPYKGLRLPGHNKPDGGAKC